MPEPDHTCKARFAFIGSKGICVSEGLHRIVDIKGMKRTDMRDRKSRGQQSANDGCVTSNVSQV
jgi:hypothetical protein